MGIPTNPNQPLSDSGDRYEELKPPQIEWIHNDPKTTKHLPTPDSGWLQSVSYDSQSLRLTMTNKEGESWQHAQIYQTHFDELQLAPSKGSYYAKYIKGHFPKTDIKRNPKPGDYPRSQPHEIKDRFQSPTNDRFNPKSASPKHKRRYA